MGANKYETLRGTLLNAFSIGKTNTMSLNSANKGGICLQVIAGRGSSLGRLQSALPTQTDDVATKGYVDSHNTHYDVYTASVALVGGRCVAMGTSGLVYLTESTLPAFVGVTAADAAANADVTVSLGPVIGGFTGIVMGKIYYLGNDGAIQTTETNCAIGVGVSTTEIRLNPMRMNMAFIGA